MNLIRSRKIQFTFQQLSGSLNIDLVLAVGCMVFKPDGFFLKISANEHFCSYTHARGLKRCDSSGRVGLWILLLFNSWKTHYPCGSSESRQLRTALFSLVQKSAANSDAAVTKVVLFVANTRSKNASGVTISRLWVSTIFIFPNLDDKHYGSQSFYDVKPLRGPSIVRLRGHVFPK